MADYKQAVQKTLIHEGGYVNNPFDAGGETYRGVSRKNWPNWSGWDIIDSYKSHPSFPKILDSDTRLQSLIIEFYREGYWKDLYSQLTDQSLAEKLFDMGVLFGVKTAVKMLQISMTNEIGLVSDGIFGPNTLAAVNQSSDLLPGYRTTLIQHVINIINLKQDQSTFVNGWVTRINS
jgi:lysozyme family protein